MSNISNNQSFFNGAGKAALWGGISATVSMGIGSMFGDVGALAKEIGRAVIHGYSNGIQSHLQGGSFGQGFLSGGISSGLSSGATGLNFGSEAMIGIGGLGGGIGSAISGGDFFHGFGQGLAVSAFNHTVHEFSGDPVTPPIDPKTGKPYLPGFKDAKLYAKTKDGRYVWKLKDGKILEWTKKNGVVEMYNKTGKRWLGKYNPFTGKSIPTTSKLGRIASYVKHGIGRFFSILSAPVYIGPGSGFDEIQNSQIRRLQEQNMNN